MAFGVAASLRQRVQMMAVGGVLAALLPWALAVFGLTVIIAISRVMRPLRRLFRPVAPDGTTELPVGRVRAFFGHLIHCCMCVGTWVGFVYALLGFQIIPELPRLGVIHIPGIHYALNAFAATGVCWCLHVILTRLGADKL